MLEEDIEIFSASVGQLFEGEEQELRRFYQSSRGIPLGYEHVAMLAEYCGVEDGSPGLRELTMGYVLISAYYFLLDAVADGHLANPVDCVYLTHLLAGGLEKISDSVVLADSSATSRARKVIHSHISENAAAIRLEKQLQENPFEIAPEEERRNIIGRSNSALLLFELMTLLYNQKSRPQDRLILEDIIYYLQLGDDLSDWREDFSSLRWTSFLRRCLSVLGRIPTEPELEVHVYLSGCYEEWASLIIRGLNSASTTLAARENRPLKLIGLVESQKAMLEAALTDWITAKLASR
jgi:hypothetical protein